MLGKINMWYKYAGKYIYSALTTKGHIQTAMAGNQEAAESLEDIFSNPRHRLHEVYKKVLLKMFLNTELEEYDDEGGKPSAIMQVSTGNELFTNVFIKSELMYCIVYSLYLYVIEHGPFGEKKFNRVAVHLRDTDLLWEIIVSDPRFKELKNISTDIVSSRPLTSERDSNFIPEWFEKYLESKVPKKIPFLHFDTGFQGSIPLWMKGNKWNVADIKLISSPKEEYLLPLYQSNSESLKIDHRSVVDIMEYTSHKLENIKQNINRQRYLLENAKLNRRDIIIFQLMQQENGSAAKVFNTLVEILLARGYPGIQDLESANSYIINILTDNNGDKIKAILAIREHYQSVIEKLNNSIASDPSTIEQSPEKEDTIFHRKKEKKSKLEDSKEFQRLSRTIMKIDYVNIDWFIDDSPVLSHSLSFNNSITFRYSRNMPSFWATYFITKEYLDIQREVGEELLSGEIESNPDIIENRFYEKLQKRLQQYAPDPTKIDSIIDNIKSTNNSSYTILGINYNNILKRELILKLINKCIQEKFRKSAVKELVKICKRYSIEIPKFIEKKYNKSINKDDPVQREIYKRISRNFSDTQEQSDIEEREPIISDEDKDKIDFDVLLVIAIEKNDAKVAKFALENGAMPDIYIDSITLLFYCVKSLDRTEITKLLIDFDANINFVSPDGDTILSKAVENNNIEIVELLLDKRVNMYDKDLPVFVVVNGLIEILELFIERKLDLNYEYTLRDQDLNSIGQTTLLIEAVKTNNFSIIDLLVQEGADIDHEVGLGTNAFIEAIKMAIITKDLKIIKYFIENGAYVNMTDEIGNPGILYAVEADDLELIKYLLENGADKKRHINYAFSAAVKHGKKEIAEVLLEKGADIDYRASASDWSILMSAANVGNKEMVEFLLEQGADVNISDYSGITALSLALRNRYFDIVNILIKHNAKINMQQCLEDLKYALGDYSPEVIEFLIPIIIIPENYVKIFNTIFTYGNERILLLFIQRGLDVNAIDEDGQNLLMRGLRIFKNCSTPSLKSEYLKMIEVLLQNGADVNFVDRRGNTSLMLIINHNSPSTIKLLIDYGANVNIKNNSGDTALTIAIRYGPKYFEVIKTLLRHGADPRIACDEGTPFSMAYVYGDEHIANLIAQSLATYPR